LGVEFGGPKADALDVHTAGFNFGKVENVVDDNEQVLS
jgi:hypothetical protein